MAWLSSHSSANKIDIEPDTTTEREMPGFTGADLIAYEVSSSVRHYVFRYTGMTKAAAATCAAAVYSTYGTDGVNARIQWQGNGSYNVDVTIHQVTTTVSAAAVE